MIGMEEKTNGGATPFLGFLEGVSGGKGRGGRVDCRGEKTVVGSRGVLVDGHRRGR